MRRLTVYSVSSQVSCYKTLLIVMSKNEEINLNWKTRRAQMKIRNQKNVIMFLSLLTNDIQ
jgi:hypothetical protein